AGPDGAVTGADASPHMLDRARANLAATNAATAPVTPPVGRVPTPSGPDLSGPDPLGPDLSGPDPLGPDRQSARIRFVETGAECLPFASGSFDVVISNGVFSLIVDKPAALREIHRVLRPGGRLRLADQMLDGPAPQGADVVSSWFR
ncbi:class I SAM-dependent methyltransferase, partial [Desulfovibrio sp. DS-1]